MTTLQPGDMLAGKYRLEEVIGIGGFATVYRAVDTTIGREVAVKLLDAAQEHGAARFVREAKILGELQDPHTMRLFDFGRAEDGTLFMVVELLGGQDLSDLLAERGRLTAAEAEHILRQILSSLREAHAAGLLHRDVKPSNIRVYHYQGDPMRATLMDFGVAFQEVPGGAKLTATGARIGTAAYMAPEQAVGADVAPATDLFGLGLVIAECLVGDLRAVRSSMMKSQAFDYGARPALNAALNAMLELDLKDRVKSANAVFAILDSGSQPHHPPPAAPYTPSAPQRVVEVREQPRYRAAAGVALALVVIAAVFVVGLKERAEPPVSVRRPSVSVPTPPPPPQREPDVREEPQQQQEEVPDVVTGCGRPPDHRRLEDRRTTVGLDVKEWRQYLPNGYDPQTKHPVLVAFHTDGGRANKLIRNAELDSLADQHGLVVIAMKASGLGWSNTFPAAIEGVLARAREEVCIDPDRVFVLGYGAGGFPAEDLSCEPWVSGVIFVSHRSIEGRLPCPDRPKPILWFQPMKSKHLPIEGGWNCSKTRQHVSLDTQLEYLKQRNLCRAGEGKKTFEHKGSVCASYSCKSPLTVCKIDGGHQFPGTGRREFDLLRCDGPNPDFPFGEQFSSFLQTLI